MSLRDQLRHSGFALADAATTVLGAFVTYRVVAHQLGVEMVGVWALTSAALFPLRFADLSINSAVTRYIGVAHGQGVRRILPRIVLAALVINLVAFALFLTVALATSPAIIHRTITASRWPDAFTLLPYLVATACVQLVAGVFGSAVLGLMRFRVYYIVGILASAIQVAVVYPLIQSYGIAGYALVQLVLYLFQMTVFAIALFRSERTESDSGVAVFEFRRFIAFAFKLNLNAVLATLVEPLAKLLLGRFADLASVGVYEIATRILTQLRAIVVAPMQPLAVAMIRMRRDDEAGFRNAYELSFVYSLTIAVVYVLSAVPLWLLIDRFLVARGSASPAVVAVAAVSVAASLIAVPAYNASIASNDVRPILSSTVLYLATTAVVGFGLGAVFGMSGVLVAITAGYIVGNASMILLCGRLLAIRPIPDMRHFAARLLEVWRRIGAQRTSKHGT